MQKKKLEMNLFLFFGFLMVASTNCLIFHCNYQNTTWSYSVGSVYTCDGIVINYDNSSTVTEIQGRHYPEKSDADVKGFFVNFDQVVHRIPKGIELFFPNLLALQWYYGNLTTLAAVDLQPFPSLKHAFFGWNKIMSIDGDLFRSTPNISEIYLNNNRIQNVGFNLLTSLNELRFVDFRVNTCTSSFAETSEAIHQLNTQLPLSCPPLTTPAPTTTPPSNQTETTTISTTTPTTCDIRCSINDETDELKRLVADLQKRIEDLERKP